MGHEKCTRCGGGGIFDWYSCICDIEYPSPEAVASVAEAQAHLPAKRRVQAALEEWRNKKRPSSIIDFNESLYPAGAFQDDPDQNYDASLVLVFSSVDFLQARKMSSWLFFNSLTSSEDGFCEMPVDADNFFCVRAVSVRNLGSEGLERLETVFRSLLWERRQSVHLMVHMNGGISHFHF